MVRTSQRCGYEIGMVQYQYRSVVQIFVATPFQIVHIFGEYGKCGFTCRNKGHPSWADTARIILGTYFPTSVFVLPTSGAEVLAVTLLIRYIIMDCLDVQIGQFPQPAFHQKTGDLIIVAQWAGTVDLIMGYLGRFALS